ncbi:ABC transporter ATP-binding protein [uncultured Roseovarius sp.]|uniref:ABC transporter ATP-binding protein n=1 Tax=uncultured Roseovarius sp. TaxID=293344 RepID=UPI002597C3C5|nr:ABC transporter ATP-binding protein [uncultured Roseovarius sp.]
MSSAATMPSALPTSGSAASTPVRISARGLSKVFGAGDTEVVAVDNVDLDIREGEFVSLLGPSGCGKSTILNMIAGLIESSSGSISLDGEELGANHFSPKLGYVFQRDTTIPWRSVTKNIGFGLELAGVDREAYKRRVGDAIAQARLSGFENAFPGMLSGGMRQRVSLMRTLVMEPEILLMDEPFGALDAHTKIDMHRLLLDIWERQHQTVVFVTHDLAEALTLSDRIILLSARPGRVKEIFDVKFDRPRDAVTLRETDEYSRLFSHIWHSLGEEMSMVESK